MGAFNAGAIFGTAKIKDDGWSSGLSKLTKGITVFGAAVAAAAVVGVKKATESANAWQKSLKNTSTLLDTEATSMQDVASSILNLDSSLGKTTELTDAMYQSFSAGAGSLDEALTITEDSAKFAKAAVTDTATAVDVLTTATNAYGSDVVSTTEASDIFFTTIKEGKINGEQLSSVIGQSIPLFASMNIPLEELGAGLATMTKQGIASSEATTQLNSIVNQFLAPSAELSAALAEVGYQSGSAFLEAEGLTGGLELLETASGGSKDKLNAMLPNINAVKGALSLTGNGAKIFSETMMEMENATGATDEAFAKQVIASETLEVTLDKVSLVVGNISRSFIEELAPGANEAATNVLTFVQSSQMMDYVATVVGTLSAGFEGLKTFLQPIAETVGPEVRDIFQTLKTETSELSDNIGGNISVWDILANVTQYTASAFRVASTITQELIEDTGALILAIKESGETIGSFFQFLTGKKSWSEVKESASEAADAFKDFGKDVVESGSEIFDSIGTEVVSFNDRVEQSSIEMETSVVTTYKSTTDTIRDRWDEMITGQKDSMDDLVDAVKNGNEKIEDGSTTTTKKTKKEYDSLIDALKDKWKSYWESVKTYSADSLSSITDAMSTMYDSITEVQMDNLENELDAIEATYEEESAALEEKYNNDLITEDEYDTALAALEASYLEEKNAKNQEIFEAEKKNDIAGVWIDAASAIAGFWAGAAGLGPIAGPIFGAAMTAAMTGVAIAQTASINQRVFTPEYADGGTASGISRINEAGGEIVDLPDGTKVYPHDVSMEIAKSSGSYSNNFSVNMNNVSVRSDEDLDYIVNKVNRKLGRMLRRTA